MTTPLSRQELPAGAASPAAPPNVAAQRAPSPLSLPAPASLEKTASAGPGNRRLDGSQYDTSLPNARVFAADTALSFAPAGDGLGGLAYAIYHFALPAYSGEGSVQTSWSSLPAAANYYIGVADYATNKWQWFSGDPAAALSLPAALDFTSPSGQVYVVVALTGTDVRVLQQVQFGPDQPPTAVLHPQYYFADAGSTIRFDASASTDDIAVVKYEWDLDGDGTFELDSGGMAAASKTYPLATALTVQVRVTDISNQSSVASAAIKIDGPGYDETEPNNDVASANPLPGPGFAGWDGNLGVDGYDGGSSDYYKLTITEPLREVLTISGPSDAFFDLTLYNSTGVTILAQSPSTPGTAAVRYFFDSPGSFILVCSYGGGAARDYTLSGTADYSTGYDEVEPNNTRAEANVLDQSGSSMYWGNLGAGGYDGGSEDWFQFNVPTDGTFFSIRLDYYSSQVNLDLELYQDDVLLASSALDGDTDMIGYGFSMSGTYYLRCFVRPGGDPAAAGDYLLTLSNLGPYPTVVLTAAPDNGTRPLAVNLDASGSILPPGTYVVQYLWDRNGDGWFEDVTAGGEPTVTSTYYAGATYTPKVRVVLSTGAYADGGTTVTVSGSPSEVEPNDDYGNAEALPAFPFNSFFGDVGPGGYNGGIGDYYGFSLPAGKTALFILDYQHYFAPIGIFITSFDGLNETVLAQSYDQDDSDTVQYTNSSGTAMNLYVVITTDPAWTGGFCGYRLYGNVF